MRTILSIVMALACISPAVAAPDFAFRGQWDAMFPNAPNYVGVFLIDGERRVTVDSPNDNGRPAKFMGYVRTVTKSHVEFIMTDRAIVSIIDCIVGSSELLHCHTTFANGAISPLFVLTRVGPGPASLVPKK